MQTSEVKAYPKVGPFTGSLGVDALAVWVPLIYFSQTAITFTKKVKVLWVTATTNFHSKSLAKYPTVSRGGRPVFQHMITWILKQAWPTTPAHLQSKKL